MDIKKINKIARNLVAFTSGDLSSLISKIGYEGDIFDDLQDDLENFSDVIKKFAKTKDKNTGFFKKIWNGETDPTEIEDDVLSTIVGANLNKVIKKVSIVNKFNKQINDIQKENRKEIADKKYPDMTKDELNDILKALDKYKQIYAKVVKGLDQSINKYLPKISKGVIDVMHQDEYKQLMKVSMVKNSLIDIKNDIQEIKKGITEQKGKLIPESDLDIIIDSINTAINNGDFKAQYNSSNNPSNNPSGAPSKNISNEFPNAEQLDEIDDTNFSIMNAFINSFVDKLVTDSKNKYVNICKNADDSCTYNGGKLKDKYDKSPMSATNVDAIINTAIRNAVGIKDLINSNNAITFVEALRIIDEKYSDISVYLFARLKEGMNNVVATGQKLNDKSQGLLRNVFKSSELKLRERCNILKDKFMSEVVTQFRRTHAASPRVIHTSSKNKTLSRIALKVAKSFK